jgi:hypothetical protein
MHQKIKHRASLRKQQVLHEQHIQKKNEMLNKMWVKVKGNCEMLCETLVEMNGLKRSVKVVSMSAEKSFGIQTKGGNESISTI